MRLDGKTSDRIGPTRLAFVCAYMPQSLAAHWSRKAKRGRRAWAPFQRHAPGRDAAAVSRAVARTDTQAFRDFVIETLSSGERMRVLLALKASVLPADEQVAALDRLHQLRIMKLVHGMVGDGDAMVIVLHDLD